MGELVMIQSKKSQKLPQEARYGCAERGALLPEIVGHSLIIPTGST